MNVVGRDTHMLLLLVLLSLTFSIMVANPKKTTGILHGGQSRSWSAEQGKENENITSGSAPPPPPPDAARTEGIKQKMHRFYVHTPFNF